MINGILFQRNHDNVLLRCLEKYDATKVLLELHDRPAGGHFGGETTTHKMLREGYYWLALFKDAHTYARKCQVYQMSAAREKRAAFPLQSVTIENPFEQWGLDVVSEINPNSSKLHKYILTTTDYFTKGIESIPLKTVNENEVIYFLQRNIITRFGVPNSLVLIMLHISLP